MKNYVLYIVQSSGVPLYYQKFTEEFEDSEFPLVSSFFGAIMQFSEHVIKEKLNVIELGKFRIFFRYQQDLIFILITDNTSSILLVNERFDRIVLTFYNCINVEEAIESNTLIEDEQLFQKFNTIMNLQDDFSDSDTSQIRSLFEREITAGEIESGAIISLKGEIYYSSLPLDDLHMALREIEIRTMVSSYNAAEGSKFILQTPKKTIFSRTLHIPGFNDQAYIVLLFDNRTNLGMADFCLDDVCQKLEKLQ